MAVPQERDEKQMLATTSVGMTTPFSLDAFYLTSGADLVTNRLGYSISIVRCSLEPSFCFGRMGTPNRLTW